MLKTLMKQQNQTSEIVQMMLEARNFVSERKWDSYHSPKNLSIALSIEAAELMEIFQWMNDQESLEISNNPEKMDQIKDELSDVFHCLLRICDVLNIDLKNSFFEKVKKNKQKYPIDLVEGRREKYNEI